MRTEEALEQGGLDRLAVGGGVAANGELRHRLRDLGVSVHVPPPVLCTDNAAMIASAARFAPALAYPDYLGLDAYATESARGERGRIVPARGVEAIGLERVVCFEKSVMSPARAGGIGVLMRVVTLYSKPDATFAWRRKISCGSCAQNCDSSCRRLT